MPPTDPLIYRFYELIMVNGPALKALIEEEFGDGIMSAIDFDMDIARRADPKGDRVSLGMTGKFLPYKYCGATGNALAYGLVVSAIRTSAPLHCSSQLVRRISGFWTQGHFGDELIKEHRYISKRIVVLDRHYRPTLGLRTALR
jgi:hypothetical protein